MPLNCCPHYEKMPRSPLHCSRLFAITYVQFLLILCVLDGLGDGRAAHVVRSDEAELPLPKVVLELVLVVDAPSASSGAETAGIRRRQRGHAAAVTNTREEMGFRVAVARSHTDTLLITRRDALPLL